MYNSDMLKIPVSLIFLSCFIISQVYGETLELQEFRSPELIIRYDKASDTVITRVKKLYSEAKNELEKKLGMNVTFKPTVFLISSSSVFKRMTDGNELITAFAVSNSNSIVLDYSKAEKTPFDLKLILKHELCHLMLSHHIRKDLLPKWLNEGVSQWVSGGVADVVQFNSDKIIRQAALSNQYLPLKDISVRFPSEKKLFFLSYEESRSITEYIDNRFGSESILNILKELREGRNIEEAVLSVLSMDYNELESSWHRHLRRKYTWIRYISDNIYWMLFFAGALVTILGFIILRIRMRSMPDDEDDDYLDLEHK
jgi:hypothetical protein